MDLRISPRSKNDRVGVACMPLRRNVPEGREGWKLTTCPNCGRECWEMPLLDVVKAQGASALCTECALRQGTTAAQYGRYELCWAKRNALEFLKERACGGWNDIGEDMQKLFKNCGASEDEVIITNIGGVKRVVVEEEAGKRIMHAVTKEMVAAGVMTPEEAEEYLKNGSDPADSEGEGK